MTYNQKLEIYKQAAEEVWPKFEGRPVTSTLIAEAAAEMSFKCIELTAALIDKAGGE